jgi:hypothetical protein
LTPRADEAILTPRADEAISADPAYGEDLGRCKPVDAAQREIRQEVEAIHSGCAAGHEPASGEVLPGGASGAPNLCEEWRRDRKEPWTCDDQEQRRQCEEQARRIDACFGISGDRPDPGGHDLAAGGESGRAPPDQG